MSTNNNEQDMLAVAQKAVELAKKGGASAAAARAYRTRDVSLEWRDGKPEKISESTKRGVAMQLYVDGRFSTVSTSDLRPDALATFINDNIAVTRALAPDPFRQLPDPELYKGQAKVNLDLEDPKYAGIGTDQGRKVGKTIEDAARAVDKDSRILSVASGLSTNLNEGWFVTSNGFEGAERSTSFFVSGEVSAKDPDGRRPEDYAYAGSRFFGELPEPTKIGREAAERALSRIGAKKGESAAMMMAVDNRAAGRLFSFMLQALTGASLQQKRSFLDGKLGAEVANPIVTIVDNPHLPRGFSSRLFDMEGIAAKPRTIVERGVLKNFYIDTYYGRKLGMAPTSGQNSNLEWTTSNKSQAEILADMKDGILVTGFLGGNSNSGTGDFSVGVQGFRVRDGKLAEAVGEMNLAGNHNDFWKKLVAIANDPFPYSALRTPTLVFENVSIAGA